jgi:hypothetical protein
MSYELVDQILEPWSSAHQLRVATEYKDEPVRSMDMVGGKDSKVQIWIDPVSPDGIVSVHLWDYHSRRKQLSGPVVDLHKLLDAAHQEATEWLSEPRDNL